MERCDTSILENNLKILSCSPFRRIWANLSFLSVHPMVTFDHVHVRSAFFLARPRWILNIKMGGSQSSHGSDGGDAKNFIEKTISEHKVVVFSKSTCPYCVRVKKLFGDIRADIFLVELNKRNDMSALQDELNRITGARTVLIYMLCAVLINR